MTLAPLLAAPATFQLHAAAASGALLLGVVQMVAPKGTLPHRTLGWIWVVLMAGTAGSSFAVTGLAGAGHFSWIHLLSLFTLLALPVAVMAARRGRIERHKRAMVLLFAGGLVITGLFTLLPGRIMNQVVFGG